ncbi:LacI family DNA-binding transcriptional regulator [Actinoplanes sp. TBRC 11911]|uniref:LacI family DNA-binding transcriptional regulator n=1 Tax=Actinoplanes sp. TBRC 11911 TaxID=2729386 RepID=UPI001B7D6950|nr:LacI family DNA-binding transcriptional regulator [Actinoplanes sp. TBRC 11911]
MKPAHRIREIAAQAGVSQATVDRVLHHRGGVRESTIADVHRAIEQLDSDGRSQTATAIQIDVIAPPAVRTALEAELPSLWPAVVHARFHHGDPEAALAKIARSRSQGLIIQAAVRGEAVRGEAVRGEAVRGEAVRGEAVRGEAVRGFAAQAEASDGRKTNARSSYDPAAHRLTGIPTITLPARTDAGATAAYLVEQWLADRAGDVLIVGGRSADFERAMAGHRRLREAADVDAVRALLDDNPSVRAVYSLLPGAANSAIVEAFLDSHRNYDVFVGNELDKENAELLRAHRISAVLHRDLRGDLRRACLALLRAHPEPVRAAVQVITPLNMPPEDF